MTVVHGDAMEEDGNAYRKVGGSVDSDIDKVGTWKTRS